MDKEIKNWKDHDIVLTVKVKIKIQSFCPTALQDATEKVIRYIKSFNCFSCNYQIDKKDVNVEITSL